MFMSQVVVVVKAKRIAKSPNQRYSIRVLADSTVFDQPGSDDYKYSLAKRIRDFIRDNVIGENNEGLFKELETKVKNYRKAKRKHNIATRAYSIAAIAFETFSNTVAKTERKRLQDAAKSTGKLQDEAKINLDLANKKLVRLLDGRGEEEDDEEEGEDYDFVGDTYELDFNNEEEEAPLGMVAAAAAARDAEAAAADARVERLFDKSTIPVASFMDGEESNCGICTELLSEHVYCIDVNKEPVEPVKCGHKYHKMCIEHWAKINPICPLCRGAIEKIRLAKTELAKPEESSGGKKRRTTKKRRSK
jgi:hypothetical protein